MIAPQFINDVAEYVNTKVAKVVLNGSLEITDFEQKEVTGGMLALNYIIPAEEISHLTLIELKDENDALITTNEVDVPINVDTMFLQTVEVKEVS